MPIPDSHSPVKGVGDNRHHPDFHSFMPLDLIRHYSAGAQVNQVLAGGISGCCTRFLTQPFDVLKIRFQLQVEPVGLSHRVDPVESSKYQTLPQAVKLILKEEGIRGFWKGHNAGQVMSITYAICQFWSYEQIQLFITQAPWLERHVYMSNFISGGLAGAVATVFTTPFDVIRTRLVAQDHGEGYKSIRHAVPILFRNEGIPGFFRGLGVTLIQIGPLVGGNFMIYRALNDWTMSLLKPEENILPAWCLLINGGLSGTASKALVYPLDFIKKRLQVQGFEEHRTSYGRTQKCTNMVHCIRLTVEHEGVLGFYKGMVPTLVKSGLTSAFYFSFYDKFKLILNKYFHTGAPV